MSHMKRESSDREKGFTGTRLNEAALALDIEEEMLARRCGLSRSTYYRRKQRKSPLQPAEIDLLDRHIAILNRATEVFEDAAEARLWLQTSQYGLGGAIPLDAIQTTVGFREVEKLLARIDHGVYA